MAASQNLVESIIQIVSGCYLKPQGENAFPMDKKKERNNKYTKKALFFVSKFYLPWGRNNTSIFYTGTWITICKYGEGIIQFAETKWKEKCEKRKVRAKKGDRNQNI